MKKLLLLILFLTLTISHAQTTFYSDENVVLFFNIEDSGERTNCYVDYDLNFTEKDIIIYRVTLGLKNIGSKPITPLNVGIASVSMLSNPFFPTTDYCMFKTLTEYGETSGKTKLFLWSISNSAIDIIKPGETAKNETYLYMYEDLEPILVTWDFGGYRFYGESKVIFNGVSKRLNEDILYKAWYDYTKSKERNANTDESNTATNTTNADALSDKLDEILNDSNFIQNNPQLVQQMTSLIRNTDFNNEDSVNRYVEEAQNIINNYLGISNSSNTGKRESKSNQTQEVVSEMDLGNDEVEITQSIEQCPGAKAESYKTKLENAGTNMEATTAYSHLANYYNYKCKCDNGVVKPIELAKFINDYAKNYSALVSKYGAMTPVNSCKSIGSASNTSSNIPSVSTSNKIQQVAKEMNLRSDEVEILEIFNDSKNLNEAYSKLKEKNIQSLNKYTLDALNKVVGDNNDFSITGSDIQSLLNGGSLTDVLKNVNLRQSNKIAQSLGLDSSQTQVLNIIATSGNKEEMTERLKQHNIQQISQTTANGLQKLLGDSYGSLPISSGDITNMLNGNFDTAIVNMKRNQDINAFTEVLGGDKELATGVYGILGALAEESNKPKTPEQLKSMFEQKLILKRMVDYNTSESESISMSTYGETRRVSYYRYLKHNNDDSYSTIRKIYKTENYNLNSKLLSETIYNSNKEFITTDFINKTKTKTILNDKGEVLISADLETGKIIVDNTKNTTELIKNKKGKIIGEKTYNSNGQLHKEKIINKKTNEIIIYANGVKYSHTHFFNKGIRKVLYFKNIVYNPNGEIALIQEHETIKYRKDTVHENGIPTIEKIYKKGILLSEKKINPKN